MDNEVTQKSESHLGRAGVVVLFTITNVGVRARKF